MKSFEHLLEPAHADNSQESHHEAPDVKSYSAPPRGGA